MVFNIARRGWLVERVRASALCLEAGKLLVVELVDPVSGQIYKLPPGGQVEPGETAQQAAVRECLEETGYLVEPASVEITVAKYDFFWAGQLFRCKSSIVPVRLKDRGQLRMNVKPTDLTSYIGKVEWLDLDEALACMKFIPSFFDATQSILARTLRN